MGKGTCIPYVKCEMEYVQLLGVYFKVSNVRQLQVIFLLTPCCLIVRLSGLIASKMTDRSWLSNLSPEPEDKKAFLFGV